MLSDDDDVVLAASAAIVIAVTAGEQRARRPRRFWIRPSILQGRKKYRAREFMRDLLLDEVDELNLEYRNDVGFCNFFRMERSDFEHLLNLVGLRISKRNTKFREAIPPCERLAVTLRFLATGDSYHSLMYVMKISKQAIFQFVPEVCDALVKALKDYVKVRNKPDIKINKNHFINFIENTVDIYEFIMTRMSIRGE